MRVSVSASVRVCAWAYCAESDRISSCVRVLNGERERAEGEIDPCVHLCVCVFMLGCGSPPKPGVSIRLLDSIQFYATSS